MGLYSLLYTRIERLCRAQENNDVKRAQAKQDIQTLLGKKDKKVKKVKEKLPLPELKAEAQLAPVLDRKPLPGLKLSSNLTSISNDRKEDSSPAVDVRSSLGSIGSNRESPQLGFNPLNTDPLPSR